MLLFRSLTHPRDVMCWSVVHELIVAFPGHTHLLLANNLLQPRTD